MQRFEYKLVRLYLGDRRELDDYNERLHATAKEGYRVKEVMHNGAGDYALMERSVGPPPGICGACQGPCPAGDYLCEGCRS